jgi:transketolase
MAELSNREAFGRALAEYGERNPRVVVLDPDTSSSTLTGYFAKRFPDRFFNMGIAEPCMVDAAVGLSLGGFIPFASAFAALVSFRAMEQVRTCVCYARTNVKLVGGYAGVSDFKDGPTHHAITDIATMRALPEMTVIVPADANEIMKWVPVLAEYEGPVYFRLSRAASLPVHPVEVAPRIGVAIQLRAGSDLTIIAAGTMAGRSLQAADQLAAEGVSARVVEMHTIKPLDLDVLAQAAEETGAIVTAEEHTVIGGLGGAVAEALGELGPVPIERVGIRDTFARTAPDPETLMDAYGLGVEDVVAASRRVLARKK